MKKCIGLAKGIFMKIKVLAIVLPKRKKKKIPTFHLLVFPVRELYWEILINIVSIL